MNSDLISRSALIEKAWDADTRVGYVQVVDVGDILEAPAMDAVPVVHGRWIHDINNLYGCSECGERETMSHKKLKNYCPNCGAKMDGGI